MAISKRVYGYFALLYFAFARKSVDLIRRSKAKVANAWVVIRLMYRKSISLEDEIYFCVKVWGIIIFLQNLSLILNWLNLHGIYTQAIVIFVSQ